MKKVSSLVLALLCTAFLVGCKSSEPETVSFSQWLQNINPEEIRWIEAGAACDDDRCSYLFPQKDLGEVVAQLQTITDAQCSLGQVSNDFDSRLTMVYGDQILLFRCMNDGPVGVLFSDPDTAATFGCGGKLLLVDNDQLWDFISDTVECLCPAP